MAVWDQVELSGADGAGNFECQKEAGRVLYQVDTVASISASGQVSKNPSVQIAATEHSVCTALGSQVCLLGEGGQKIIASLSLESDVDVVCWNSDGSFLIVAERNGQINFVDAKYSHQRLFSQTLVNGKDEGEEKTFLDVLFTPVNSEGSVTVLVLSSDGQLFKLGPVFLDQLGKVLAAGDLAGARVVQQQITLQLLDIRQIHTECTTRITTLPDSNSQHFISAGCGRAGLAVWQTSGTEPVRTSARWLNQSHVIRKIQVTADGRYLFILGADGILTLWSVELLTALRQWTGLHFEDFLLVQSGETNSWRALKLVTLTANSDKSLVQIYSLPNMSLAYTLQLSSHTTLAKCPISQEAVYILEGLCNESEDVISTFRMCSLMESAPETRLNRLLHKQQFEEAVTFAQEYKLDVQLVYKMKCGYLLDWLSPWKSGDLTVDDINDLFEQLSVCFHSIEDTLFVARTCRQAVFRTYHQTLQSLTYAKSRLTGNGTVLKSEEQQELTQILIALHRLNTFEVAFGVKQFSGAVWSQFVGADLMAEFLHYLSRGSLSTAVSIWRRHQTEFEAVFSEDTIKEILLSIPEHTKSVDIKPWLSEDFIPYVIRILPSTLCHIASWLEQKARNMELLEKADWPENALEMSQLLHKVCLSVTNMTSDRGVSTPAEFATLICSLSVGYSLSWKEEDSKQLEKRSCVDPFMRLQQLCVQLTDLLSLHRKYNCHLSLADFVQETTESLTYRMLDHVIAVELVQNTINNIILPYIREQRLDKDKVLFNYIQDLLERSARKRSCVGEAPWEAKAIAVIECIDDPGYKCSAILDVMKRAYVPWSEDMEALVSAGLQLSHSRVAELREQCHLMDIVKMLRKYDLLNYDVYNRENAETLVYYILNQDKDTAMEDALMIVASYTHLNDKMAYVFRLRFLIKHNRVSEAIEMLYSLAVDKAVHCAWRLLIGIRILLDETIVIDEKKAQHSKLQQTRAGCELCKVLLKLVSDADDKEEVEGMLSNLRNISALQEEFGVFMSYTDYSNKSARETLLKKKVHAFFQGEPVGDTMEIEKERKVKKNDNQKYTRIYRLAELLLVSRDQFRRKLAILAAQLGQIDTALRLCSELASHTAETADTLYHVAYNLSQHLARHEVMDHDLKVSKSIHQLASQALVSCLPDLLPDCLELCQVTSLASRVLKQCETGDYGQAVQYSVGQEGDAANKDPYQHWTYDKYFHEDGLVMDSSQVKPLAYQYAIACIPNHEEERQPFYHNRLASSAASVCIKQNGNEEADGEEKNRVIMSPQMIKLSESAQTLINHLRENSQNELALEYCMSALHTVLEYSSSRNMPALFSKEGQNTAEGDQAIFEKSVCTALSATKDISNTLLVKVCHHGFVDHGLALGYLCTMLKPAAIDRLGKVAKNAGANYKRLMALSRIGSDYAELVGEKQIQVMCKNQETDAYWGAKLAKIKIPFQAAFNKDSVAKGKLLAQIVSNEAVGVNLINEYCSTFTLDVDEALILYLTHILQRRNADCKHSINRISKQMSQIIKQVRNHDKLITSLHSTLNLLDLYDYDKIDMVLASLMRISSTLHMETGSQLLNHLRSYKRVAPPSEYEKNYKPATEEEQMVYGTRPLSELSSERLPFHPFLFGEPWKIISPELNCENVAMWTPIVSILKLSLDTVYLTTMHNIVNKYLKNRKVPAQDTESKQAVDHSQFSWNREETFSLFEKIHSLLMKVENCEKAVAGATWVIKSLPIGPEKVLALKSCIALAHRWMLAAPKGSQEREKATASHHQFSSICRRLSTEQILYQYKVAESELLELTQAPAKLIFMLFEHDSILKRPLCRSALDSYPDINEMAKEIAAINKVDFIKIVQTMVDKWLPSGNESRPEDADMTMTFNFGVVDLDTTITEAEISQEEINLKRVIYLFQQGRLEENLHYLFSFACKMQSSNITTMCRVRALRCLFALADIETIERLFTVKADEFRSLLLKLLYLSELEHLHVPHTLSSFQSCNKERLVRGIWKDHNHEKRAVRLVADLCLDYKICDVQLWNSVLQQLSAFNMTDYLRHVLVCLSGVPELWQVSSVQTVWKNTLHTAISQAVAPLSADQIRDSLQVLSLLHRCPILMDMDIGGLAKHFERLELPAFAVACCVMLTSQQSKQKIEAILGDSTVNNSEQSRCLTVLDQIEDFYKKGTPVPMQEHIKEEVYSHIDHHQMYEMIHTSPHMPSFVHYLVNTDAIEQLTVYLLSSQRITEAAQLVTYYLQFHPEFTDTQTSTSLNLLKDTGWRTNPFSTVCTGIADLLLQKFNIYLNEKSLLDSVWEYLPEDELDESGEEQQVFSKTMQDFNVTKADIMAWKFTEED